MELAVQEAKKGENTAFPNPMVGAILVGKEQRLLAKGYHEKPGSLHAERNALLDIEVAPQGSILYVTLEPCCSWGRTPPCVDVILEKKIKHVVIGMLDPDVRMRGRSVSFLRERGVRVDVGILEEECRVLNARYLNIRRQNRPTIAIKAGASLDGKIVDAHGNSKWITSSQSRLHAHQLRSVYDGILIGSGTLLIDDPSLDCRIEGGRNPTPIILDTHGRCPSTAKVLTAGKRPILCIGAHAKDRIDLPVELLIGETLEEGGLQIRSLLSKLYERGMYTVLVEGGGSVIRSFILEGCVDILELYVGATFLGGGGSWGEGSDFLLSQAPRLRLRTMNALGNDVHLSYFWES